jgi:hypothetical protein
MPDDRRDFDKEYQTLMNALAESVLKESPEELANDLRVEGIDPGQYTEEVRQAMLDAVKAHEQQALHKARRTYSESVAAYEQRKIHLPTSSQKRREIFERAIRRDPEFRQQLTMQHRDFTDLTDEDIESYLWQLHELDVLTDDDLKDE